jgi:Fe-Mn family superoxide dismutase
MQTMTSQASYQAREFDLSGLNGISDRTLAMHFKLYRGYVKQTNLLNEQIREIAGGPEPGGAAFPAYSELKRRLGFEYNGMVLHEYYFENLKKGGARGRPESNAAFTKAVEESFGDYDRWKMDFSGTGAMRGVGWAICYQDPSQGRLSNHWIDLHEAGNISGFRPILVMDVWEHAYLLDYAPSDRPDYIESFFSNIDWDVVDGRMGVERLAAIA